jgi:5,10-methylenetetrahydrofolate reductase
MRGQDLSGNALHGAPSFCLGAVVDPGAADLDVEIRRMERKVEAEATFFQTQAVFDIEAFARFIEATRHLKVPILAGVIVLKSGEMARNVSQRLPGVRVPASVIAEMEEAEDRVQTGLEVAGRTISQLRELTHGVHIIAPGWERHIPQVLENAGLLPALSGGRGASHP